MSDTDRPDLAARSRPRPAENLADPADPTDPPARSSSGDAGGAGGAERHRPMVAIDTGSTATYAIQYRLTEGERSQLLRMQEARGDRRGIDTMRWFLANFAEKAIEQARRETEASQHHYR